MNFYSYYGFVPILMAGVGFNINFPTNFAVGTDTITNFGFNDDLTLVRGSHQFSFRRQHVTLAAERELLCVVAGILRIRRNFRHAAD